MMPRALVLCLMLCLTLCQACSLIFVSGPPDGHERLRYFDCVSNGAAPAADASWAITDALFAAGLASQDGKLDNDGKKIESSAAAGLFGVAAAVHAGSMIYGLVQTHRCGGAKQHLQQRISDQDIEHKRLIEQLEQNARAQQAQGAAPPAEAPRTLELAPASAPEAQPAPAPAEPVVPPPPDAYKQPAPTQP